MRAIDQKTIPNDWRHSLLDDYIASGVIELTRGNVISKNDIQNNPGDNPIYSSSVHKEALFGRYNPFMFDEELITWSVDGGGNFFYRPKHKFSVTNVSGILRILKKDRLIYKYLFFLLDWEHSFFKFDYQTKAHPSVIRKMYEILEPSLAEQKRIVEILTSVDDEVKKIDTIIEQTTELKNGLMQDLFIGGIGHKNFKKTAIGTIPANWDIKKLEEVVFFENGKAHENFIDDSGEFVVVNSKFIAQNGDVVKRTNKGLKILNKGDIAIVMSDIPQGKALAKCFFVDEDNKYTLNQRIGLLRPLSGYNKYFFYFLNRNKYFLDFSNETSQTNLRKQQVLDCPIVIPSASEQKQIAEIISSIDEKLSINMQHKETLLKLKKGLSQDLLTGKVRTI